MIVVTLGDADFGAVGKFADLSSRIALCQYSSRVR